MKIYSMNISKIDPYDERWFSYLSPKRREKVKKIKKKQQKAQSIGAELLLNYAVRKETGINKTLIWDTERGGKLFLPEYPEIHVNLSHSGDFTVLAVDDLPIGIDIQKHREYDMSLVKRFFSEDEVRYITGSTDKMSSFYEIWTKKESLLKAAGKGIRVALNSFSVLCDKISFDGHMYGFKEYRVSQSGYTLYICSSARSSAE